MSFPSPSAQSAAALDEALDALSERLPHMSEAARAFASLALAAEEIVAGEATWPPFAEFDAEAFSAGTPLLAAIMDDAFVELFHESAGVVLPALRSAFPSAASAATAFGAALEDRPGFAGRCVRAVMAGDAADLDALAEEIGLPGPLLGFLLQETVRPCLRRAASRLGQLADDGLWGKSHCPVCGSRPDIGYLKEKSDPSEFLITKAGKLWLHCSLCGHGWRFVRLVCPSCGQADHERLEVLSTPERPEERIHVCKDCKRYLPVADLSRWKGPFLAEIAPLGLVHLDILAQENGYAPVTPRPWNTF